MITGRHPAVIMALKSTSSPIVISTAFQQGVANTFEAVPVDLQLNPLDQEVFVVTAVKIDFDNLPFTDNPGGAITDAVLSSSFEVAVCKNRPSTMQTIGSSNVVAASQVFTLTTYDGSGNPLGTTVFEQNPMDAPPSQLDYLDIIATDNFFIGLDGLNGLSASNGSVRLFGYRARADAATYAALVQSEMLSQ